jgi:hypothetical protein
MTELITSSSNVKAYYMFQALCAPMIYLDFHVVVYWVGIPYALSKWVLEHFISVFMEEGDDYCLLGFDAVWSGRGSFDMLGSTE